jgi:hypothetical protein
MHDTQVLYCFKQGLIFSKTFVFGQYLTTIKSYDQLARERETPVLLDVLVYVRRDDDTHSHYLVITIFYFFIMTCFFSLRAM